MAEHDPTERALLLLSLLQTHRFWPGRRAHDPPRGERPDPPARRRPAAGPGLSRRRDAGGVGWIPPRRRGAPPTPAAGRRRSRCHRGRAACRGRRVHRRHGGHRARCPGQARAGAPGPAAAEGARGALERRVAAMGRCADRRCRHARGARVGCRDHEQVRFEYRRRDGDETSRLVEPHQLVSTGRRWYLVAWDVRRDDWRTFRLDRLERARLAGVRCARARPARR